MNLSMIVAMTPEGVIGKDNDLPWPRIKEDMKHFRKYTKGHVIIMGRKTYESLGKPLMHRANFVLTRNSEYRAPGCFVFTDVNEMLEEAFNIDHNPVVIGGAGIYELLLPKTTTLYLTKVNEVYEGDTYFPELNRDDWSEETLGITPQVIFTKLTRKS